MVDLSPVDYLSGLGGLQNLPNPMADQQQVQALRTTQLQQQALSSRLQQEQEQQRQQQQFQRDVMALGNNPNANDTAALIRKYPGFAEQIKGAYDIQDEAKRQSDFGVSSQIYSAANAGRYDLAAKLLRSHMKAEQDAGIEADPTDEAIAAALESGDPAEQKRALGMVGLHIASIEPKKFADTYGALKQDNKGIVVGEGSSLVDLITGEVRFQAPQKTEYRNVGAGDTVVAIGGDGGPSGGPNQRYAGGWTPRARNGGDNDDAAVDNKITGVARQLGVDPDSDISKLSPDTIARALAFGEGGAGSLADRNNNPTNIRGTDGSYRKFPNTDAAYAAAGKLVAGKLGRGQTTVRSLIEGLPVGGQGGARVVAQGAPKPGYHVLSPQEVAQVPGLDPNKAYQVSPEGQITAIGGSDKGSLKPLPVPVLQARASNKAALTNIDGALALLNPENKSAEAQRARNAIGFGTGALGDRFTQLNDPGGTDFRARIGQIGGIIIKDTSGAAVSLSEDQRLAKWVPLVTDSPGVARSKLNNLKREIQQRDTAIDDTFNEDQGYRPFNGGNSSSQPVRVSSPAEAAKLAPGTLYIRPDGKVMRR